MVTQRSSKAAKPKRKPATAKTASHKTIFQILDEAHRSIPADEAARHPSDGARNLDYYLYGTPRQEPE